MGKKRSKRQPGPFLDDDGIPVHWVTDANTGERRAAVCGACKEMIKSYLDIKHVEGSVLCEKCL